MKPALPWGTAARIAWRELHASRAKFLFVLLSVAIGVGALTGVRGFSDSFQRTLLGQARSLMAADLAARMFRQATPHEEQQLNALGQGAVERTEVTEMVSMASVVGDPIPLLVSLKAVDPQSYPFYGQVVLDPQGPITQMLTDSTVLVDDNLLVRLHARVGDALKIGGHVFRIAAVIVREPDRLTAGVGLGPRVMMTRHMLEETGLLEPGSRATERYLFKLPKDSDVASARARLEHILPDAQVTDFRETNPALTDGLNHATGLLSLICLVAMVLGAIGVGMAMRAHLQQRIEILAIMKSIGARASDILRIYLLQTFLLGAGGAAIGVLLGVGVEYTLPAVLGKLLPLRPEIVLPLGPVLAAFGTGILTTVLFCLPPLLEVRNIRPVVVLRRTVTAEENGRGWRDWLTEHKLQLGSVMVILAGLGGIAAGLSDSWLVGKWFTACLAALLVFILLLSAVVLRGLRAFLARTRLHLPSALRHGLANLYRPGNQSSAVLAALGAGVMLILSVFLMQQSIVRSLRTDAAPTLPNLFLIDIATNELEGVQHLVETQHGVQGKMEAIPIVSGRIVSINGTTVEQLRLQNYPKHLLRAVSLTFASKVPAGAKVVAGRWWTKDSENGVAIVDRVARRLKVQPGSAMVFAVGETQIQTRVAAVYSVDGGHAFARSEFVMAPDLLKGQPTVWYGDVHVDAASIPQLERSLFAAYPTVTVINVADILDTIQTLVDQITVVIRFLAAFSILSGLVILASSVASTRFRRIREVVVLKTLGATRGRIATVFSIEFVVLGLLAGAVGAVFANVLSRILLHRMEIVFVHNYRATAIAVVATAGLAVVTGWVASFRILGQRPLQVLREE